MTNMPNPTHRQVRPVYSGPAGIAPGSEESLKLRIFLHSGNFTAAESSRSQPPIAKLSKSPTVAPLSECLQPTSIIGGFTAPDKIQKALGTFSTANLFLSRLKAGVSKVQIL